MEFAEWKDLINYGMKTFSRRQRNLIGCFAFLSFLSWGLWPLPAAGAPPKRENRERKQRNQSMELKAEESEWNDWMEWNEFELRVDEINKANQMNANGMKEWNGAEPCGDWAGGMRMRFNENNWWMWVNQLMELNWIWMEQEWAQPTKQHSTFLHFIKKTFIFVWFLN